ncbi:MAG: tetracycline resistance MFS efflux pump [Anaerolineae bacterium]
MILNWLITVPRRLVMVGLRPVVALRPASRQMALALFLWGIGEGLWIFVRPLYVAELGGNPAQAGQVLAAAGLAPMLLMLPSGRIIDRFGPRMVLVVNWWIGTVSAVLLALAPGWEWLFLGFFMYSVSASAIPAIDVYVARDVYQDSGTGSVESRDMQAAIAVVFAAYFAGTILSPLVGGWLGETLGLRNVFWFSAVWFLFSTLVVQAMPSLPDYHHVEHPASHESQRAWWQFTPAQRRVYATLLTIFFFVALGYALIPSYLEIRRGLTFGILGALGSATAIGGMVWMLVLGRFHSRVAIGLAALLLAVAFAGVLLTPAGGWLVPAMVGVYFLLGIYLTIRTLALQVASEYTPPQQHGTAFGMVETMFGVGAFVGPWAAGLLFTAAPEWPFLVAAIALVPLAGAAWWLLRPPGAVIPPKSK